MGDFGVFRPYLKRSLTMHSGTNQGKIIAPCQKLTNISVQKKGKKKLLLASSLYAIKSSQDLKAFSQRPRVNNPGNNPI